MNFPLLKFRAWSTKQNKFLAVGFHIIGETTLFDLLNQHKLEELNDIIITQYIGINDNKDKDIYEGDIIKVKGYDDWFDEEGFYHNMLIKQKHFKEKEYEKIGYNISTDREVIGNVFENPELKKYE